MNAMAVPIADYVGLSAVIFFIGVAGVIVRRNPLIMLMSIELMFNAANLNLAAFDRFLHPAGAVGQTLAIFTMTVAAAEIVVGLALLLAIYRNTDTTYVEDFNLLKG